VNYIEITSILEYDVLFKNGRRP